MDDTAPKVASKCKVVGGHYKGTMIVRLTMSEVSMATETVLAVIAYELRQNHYE